MKIIAQAVGGFLLEATATEIANILGHRWESAIRGQIVVGATIPIEAFYRRAEGLHAGAEDVLRVSKTLRALADLAAEAVPSIMPPIKPAEAAS